MTEIHTSIAFWDSNNPHVCAWIVGRIAEHLEAGRNVRAVGGGRWCYAATHAIAKRISDELSAQGIDHACYLEPDGVHHVVVFEVA